MINWMRGRAHIHNISLTPLANRLKQMAMQFHYITLEHIYKEKNGDVDLLTKEGLALLNQFFVLDSF